ncbi:MAG TPA: NUDIX domain-containing protein [Nitrolancea sp.]|nr:NUDIX domain-containing protein [Nitrolancea sp.]
MSYNFKGAIQFCPHCTALLVSQDDGGQIRPHCPSCNVTFYQDPKLAVAVLVNYAGGLVLQRRSIDPGMGKWTFPSGYVERGERVEDAAIRETFEETGLEVRLTNFIGLYSHTGNPVVLAVYAADAVGGNITVSPESDEVASFVTDDLPELAFDHDSEIVATWLDRSR